MNNNRNNNNNNRRRGRGNNNRPQGGGRGEMINRIDSRARGNAPQMLEKYKKLAQDAHLNGDRVTAEYYLQFADHYFRVIADTRQRQEEQRMRRDGGEAGQGEQSGNDENDNDDNEFGMESDFPSYDQPYRRDDNRDPQQRREPAREQQQGQPRAVEGDEEGPREDRGNRAPAPNPFTRDNQAMRSGLRPRSNRGDDRQDDAGSAPRGRGPRRERSDRDNESGSLDPSLLPPAITEARDLVRDAAVTEATGEATAEAPKRRTRRARPPAEDAGGEPLETVNG
ncbi:DUF4167 domain-containing protein [Novosphingobium tardum]|uniref:DUF4167 domain-containing protein n=1 Tax=Novosphingobium tardum TaxID=1538021 RepID=A0ABV8RJW7_9SPHN